MGIDYGASSKSEKLPRLKDSEADPFVLARRSGESSSSASPSSSDELFQVSATTLGDDESSFSAEVVGNGQLVLKHSNESQLKKDDERSFHGSTPHLLREWTDEVLGPSSSLPISDLTHDSLGHILSPTQSPQIQVMQRESHGYVPGRIPSSVFARSKSTAPMEWSVASNESLFSIHIGNSSFSRDHVVGIDGDLSKSGELMKSGEFIAFSPTAPMAGEEDSVDTEKKLVADGGNEVINNVAGDASDNQSDEVATPPAQISWNSSNISRHSDGSGTSTRSFAFPILAGGPKSGKIVEQPNETKLQQVSGEVNPNATTSRWFPCPSCCSCSSCWSSCSGSSCFSCCPCGSCSSLHRPCRWFC